MNGATTDNIHESSLEDVKKLEGFFKMLKNFMKREGKLGVDVVFCGRFQQFGVEKEL